MQVFSDHERNDAGPKLNRESEYAFLDRSARPEIGKVREFIQQLCESYPANELNEMVARIQCGDDRQLNSAIFELLLYSALANLGCKLEPHPSLPNGLDARPDFLVVTPAGDEFYLEAVLASRQDDWNPAAQARIESALDLLGKVTHPNFMVALENKHTNCIRANISK